MLSKLFRKIFPSNGPKLNTAKNTEKTQQAEGEIVIGLRDKMFAHAHTVGNGNLPKIETGITWDRSERVHAITLFTDLNLDEALAIENTYKVAWMIESPSVNAKAYRELLKVSRRFDSIFTFYKKILDKDSKAIFTPLGGCWIEPQDWKIYKKHKNLSIIASDKASLPGQKLRHKIIRKFNNYFDEILGGGYKYIENKLEGLKDYRYSVVVENCREDYYFSEKLIDCFMTGTIPIYWGCPSISMFFDTSGILTFSTMNELKKILINISENDYQSRISAVNNNFKLAQNYAITEKHVLRNLQEIFQ